MKPARTAELVTTVVSLSQADRILWYAALFARQVADRITALHQICAMADRDGVPKLMPTLGDLEPAINVLVATFRALGLSREDVHTYCVPCWVSVAPLLPPRPWVDPWPQAIVEACEALISTTHLEAPEHPATAILIMPAHGARPRSQQ